ncbi:fungal-specific transcription factor domain-containing protein [Trichophaea hybrida]|nr:fungal-specific transcription factor domain-containing protein [Trichophaea hybrida]
MASPHTSHPHLHTQPSPVVLPPTPTQLHHQRRQSTVTNDCNDNSSEEDLKRTREDRTVDEQGRKRRRIDGISSCETCKARKVKCDRAQPSCGWCSRNGQECIYRQKKKPGLRAGIGRELEERLDRVEAMLDTHNQLLKGQIQQHQQQQQQAAQFPSPSTVSHHSPHGGGTQTNSPPFPPIIADIAFPKKTCEITDFSTSKSFDPDLPTDDVLYSLINLFFQHIHPICPIIHRATLLDTFFPQRHTDPVTESDVILMHAIVATALRFTNDRHLSESWKSHFRTIAKQKVIMFALEKPCVESLRAIVIIVLDVVGSTNGPSGWGLMALTTRMALHLGLALEPPREAAATQISTMGVRALPECVDWIEEEGRRRLFWMIYFLDVITSLGTSLDLNLDESEIERQLPCRDSLWDRNQYTSTRWFQSPSSKQSPSNNNDHSNNIETLSSFSYQIEVIGILGRIHRFLRETVDINVPSDVEKWQLKYRTLDKSLTDWKHSLPMPFGNLTRALGGASVDVSWVMLHACYNTAVIRLHSVAAYPAAVSHLFRSSFSASQRCLDAVENITALTRLALSHNLIPLLGPTFSFTIWVATRVLLVHASATSAPSIPDTTLFLDALHAGGKLWEVAGRYCGIIERVIDELERGERSCVQILVDMRMTAYSVDVMISQQPDLRVPVMPAREEEKLDGDFVDLFGWFNLPRVPGGREGSAGGGNGWMGGVEGEDWLFPV